MAGRRTLFFWKFVHGVPLFEHVVGLLFPVVATVMFTLLIDMSLRELPPVAAYATPLTVLFSLFLFFIILWLQQLILSCLFKKALAQYLHRTKGRHPVTKVFGAEILSRFLSQNFKPEMVEGIESLSSMLEKLEQPNGQPLALVSYAILLDKAADMEPDKLFAVWHFEAVPMSEVFTDSGEAKPDYAFYLETLGRIYSMIPSAANKRRVFLFRDDEHRQEVMTHPGWQTLMAFMRDWGILDYHYGNADVLDGIRKHVAFSMDDFVWFSVSGCVLKYSWIIGFEKHSKIASLGHGDIVVKDAARIWQHLQKLCSPAPVGTATEAG